MPAACCLLPAACRLLPAACCLLPAACCLLPAACVLVLGSREVRSPKFNDDAHASPVPIYLYISKKQNTAGNHDGARVAAQGALRNAVLVKLRSCKNPTCNRKGVRPWPYRGIARVCVGVRGCLFCLCAVGALTGSSKQSASRCLGEGQGTVGFHNHIVRPRAPPYRDTWAH